ncbi:MAG: PepSY domain-containing protein [Proteobacteria bacterium]|nr:PepSY domain-containing protein [Pseudomonadota bacterium]MCK4866420.1 PepSY domain-containing protein [Alphaproteobacteria bacterium]
MKFSFTGDRVGRWIAVSRKRGEPILNAIFIRGSGSRAYLWTMRLLIIFLTLTGLTGLPGESTVRADADPEQIRAATESGQIRPLTEILNIVSKEVPGKVLAVQVDNDGSPWLYRIKVRGQKGNVKLVTVNAETGEITDIKGQR